ncbi:hypothetical protein NDU88_009273 [Pleurodeles waltl]|uniref:Uncharacterized protein n=1 Tax=Pleurodeles waltl TaxID=8319 RepID=A0AAV7PUR7_PLEWA|nr:hypothetical protein NDU88_009273 [Pleurodeles waltl]
MVMQHSLTIIEVDQKVLRTSGSAGRDVIVLLHQQSTARMQSDVYKKGTMAMLHSRNEEYFNSGFLGARSRYAYNVYCLLMKTYFVMVKKQCLMSQRISEDLIESYSGTMEGLKQVLLQRAQKEKQLMECGSRESELADLQCAYRELVEQSLLRDIRDCLEEYNDVAQREVMHLGNYATARVYDEQPDTMLVALLQRPRKDRVVLSNNDEQGMPLHEADHVLDFFHYYEDLYGSCIPHNEQATTDHLSHITMKWLTVSIGSVLWHRFTPLR